MNAGYRLSVVLFVMLLVNLIVDELPDYARIMASALCMVFYVLGSLAKDIIAAIGTTHD